MNTEIIQEIRDVYALFLDIAQRTSEVDLDRYCAFLAGLPDDRLVELHGQIMQYGRLMSEEMAEKSKRHEQEIRSMEESFVSSAERRNATSSLVF